MAEADQARLQALVERLLAERRRDGRLADQRQLDRQRADLQHLGEVLASWAVTPEICAPVRPSIPFGLSTKLMIGREISSPSRTIANEPENWSASLSDRRRTGLAGGGEAVVGAALGDLRR